MTTVEVFAPAKINLTLHVTGQRADGYHLLDSLVAFAPIGDRLTLKDARAPSITVDGAEAAGVPTDATNLAVRAAALMRPGRDMAITLTKALPPASGIGGGSADAAAAVRAALLLDDPAAATRAGVGQGALSETRFRALLDLGADIPMCLVPKTLRARGIGEDITAVPLPPVPAVLVNPRVAVPTPAVFKALDHRDNPAMPDPLPEFTDTAALITWLSQQRNDLEAPACAIAPVIGDVLAALEALEGCGLARMSGSGATCFGLFVEPRNAEAAADRLQRDHPKWWIKTGVLGDQSEAAMPVIS